MPGEYGSWSTVYDRFRSWAATGVFHRWGQPYLFAIRRSAAWGSGGHLNRSSTRSQHAPPYLSIRQEGRRSPSRTTNGKEA
ncbi:transposase [Nonomuraea basaltis]|nr:transposase [Nonomuraea basaltis]